VHKYVRELGQLARRFKEMNERTVVLKFWSGLNSELREIMAISRAEPEVDDLDEIIIKAKRAENSLEEQICE
ncbi:hypothetical protein BDM02DRAFT_3106262, partial [Thelephora ganbajun]